MSSCRGNKAKLRLLDQFPSGVGALIEQAFAGLLTFEPPSIAINIDNWTVY